MTAPIKRATAFLFAVAALAFIALEAEATPDTSTQTATVVVASVYDGDTLTLTNGKRVRLLQIDTPELGSGKCYSRAARTALLQRVPIGSRVRLEVDRKLDRVDRYGRPLRYVHRETMNVNVALVRAGAAAPYFYGGDRGRYASRLLREAQRAKAAKRGLWKACPGTKLDPYRAVDTGTSGPSGGGGGGGGSRCDPSYPGVCIPPYPPDLDCDDVPYTDFEVRPPDPHGFDGDGDGVGARRSWGLRCSRTAARSAVQSRTLDQAPGSR